MPLYDEDIPDYELDDLSDEEEMQPEQNKQLVLGIEMSLLKAFVFSARRRAPKDWKPYMTF